MAIETHFITSDIITYVLAYLEHAAAALRRECGLSVTRYRMLSYLSDHVDGSRPTELAQVLAVSPALVTAERKRLEQTGLAALSHGERGRRIEITKRGVDKARDSDVVLSTAHSAYFAPLTPDMRVTVESGSMLANLNTLEGNRLRDGHFFSAYETLHAFLIVESYLTNTTQSEGLPLTGYRILLRLGERGGPLRPSALAESMLLGRPAVSAALTTLEEAGHAERAVERGDHRAAPVRLTPQGEAKLAAASERIETVFTGDQIKRSARSERDAYRDIASVIVSARLKQRHSR